VENCIFCQIVGGQAPASVVHVDDQVIVIMDKHPRSPGHALVIPRFHAASLTDLDENIGAHLFRIAMRIDRALRASKIPCDAIRLVLSDGRAAGQEVAHVHLHVIPCVQGRWPGRQRDVARSALDEDAARMSRAYQTLYGS